MVKIIGIDPKGYFVILRLENGMIMRVREDSFELDNILDRAGEKKSVDYSDLLLVNDFIVKMHRMSEKTGEDVSNPIQLAVYDAVSVMNSINLLLNGVYKPIGPCPPPPKEAE